MGTELTGKTIAAEAGLVERTVSFTKGCYTGQELVARIDSRGSNVARRLVGVVAPAGPPGGDALGGGHDPARGGGLRRATVRPTTRSSGPITSAAWSVELGAWVALGYLHRNVEAPGPVRVRSGDGVGGSRPARAELLPLIGTADAEQG